MEFINATSMVAGYTLGVEPNGRELLVVVVKGTFRIPVQAGATIHLHEEQMPLVMSDVYFGEPGLSAPRYEMDFAPRKPRCDVLLTGSAYAPRNGRPTQRMVVGLQLGSWSKSFMVVGDRVWIAAGGVRASSPAPFTVMPISYDRAFGGTDLHHEDSARHAAFMPNPSGRGFHRHLVNKWLEGSPLPNTEELGNSVRAPNEAYQPMSFGVVGRHWMPRLKFAGTYDKNWLANEFPFLPADFSEQYYQAAPPDQQLPVPLGEQLVSLKNLTPEGTRDFVLPHWAAPIHVFPKKGPREDLAAHVDTINIEPDEERVTMTWRLTKPLRKNLFEIAQVLVGKKGSDWWQARERQASPFANTGAHEALSALNIDRPTSKWVGSAYSKSPRQSPDE